MPYKTILFILALCSQIASCNLFQDFADKDSKEARVEEAKIQIDKGNFASAIDILDSLVVEFPTDPEIATLRSSAYAAAAGIGLMDIGFNIASLTTSTNPIDKPFDAYFAFVMSPTDTELQYALAARDSLVGYSASSATRTNEMNMFLTILSYGIVATILSAKADITPNDNKTDATFDCTAFSDNDTKEVIYTYAVAKQSIASAHGSSLWDGIEKQVTAFANGIETLGIDLNITSKSQVTSLQCAAMKSIIVGGLLGAPTLCLCN